MFSHYNAINTMLASGVPFYNSIHDAFNDEVHGIHWHKAVTKEKNNFAKLGIRGESCPISELCRRGIKPL